MNSAFIVKADFFRTSAATVAASIIYDCANLNLASCQNTNLSKYWNPNSARYWNINLVRRLRLFPYGCEQSQAECEGQMKYLSVTAVVGKVTTIMSGRSGIELHQPCFTFTCLFRHLTRKFFLALAYFLCRNHLWHSQIHPLLTLKPTSGKFHINSKVIDNLSNLNEGLLWKKRMFFQSCIFFFFNHLVRSLV